MNRLSLLIQFLHSHFSILPPSARTFLIRAQCMIERKPYLTYLNEQAPRWQQLELPLSHTPVQKWKR